jgi:Tfp pilus assembly protein PilF
LDPQLAEPRYRLGRVYAKQNKLGEAVEQLEAAVRAKPGWPEPHYQLALAYLKLRKKDAAQREFQIHRKLQNDQEQERAERIRDVKQFILMLE